LFGEIFIRKGGTCATALGEICLCFLRGAIILLLEAGAPTGKIDSKASHEESEIPIFAANTKAGVNGAYALNGEDYKMILKSESIHGMQSLGA
jgi:hypothetical protein